MKIGNPAPVGLFGFGVTTWLLSSINAGIMPGSAVPMVLASAFAFGGTAQLLAGLMEAPRGNTFGFVAFCSYGAFWITFGLFVEFFAKGVPGSAVGTWLLLWAVFTAFMFIGTFALNKMLQIIFGLLLITFLLLGFGEFGMGSLHTLGGYFGLATAVAAMYLGGAEVINEVFGRTVLPIGAPAPKA